MDNMRLAHSSDRGATFDWRASVHDATAGRLFVFADLALEPDGALDLAYYAGGADEDPMGSFRIARSTDGGRTFAPSQVVQQPLLFTTSRTTLRWIGDYVGIDYGAGRLVGAYGDNSGAADRIAFFATAPR
jgi:hypothetical protein